MAFYPRSQFCQGTYLFVREASFIITICQFNPPRTTTRFRLDHQSFVPQMALDDLSCGRMNNEVVRVNRARDNCLTKARAGINHGLAAMSSKWIGCEEHACYCGIDHALNSNCQTNSAMVDAITGTVTHCPVSPEGSPAAFHSIKHSFDPANIQVGILLTCEARVGQIFGGG